MKIFVLNILLLLSLNSSAQKENKPQTDTIQINSVVLSESRNLWIHLPVNYSPTKKYPVSFVLDGETLFESHKSIVGYLSQKNVIPEMIIVGIINTQRGFNLTHVKDTLSNLQPNGGGVNFEAFILDELIPYIDSNYATAPFRILSGHSLSGLFGANLLLNSVNEFNAYLLMDPALWWNDMEVLGKDMLQAHSKEVKEKRIFLSIANSLPSGMTELDDALLDTTNATLGIRSVFAFRDRLASTDFENVNWKSHYYNEESHGTVPFKSTYDGMKFIFDYYKKPSFQTLSDSSSRILDNHYDMLSKKMNYRILPSAYDLSGLAWRCQDLEKNNERAYSFLKLYIQYYPEDPLAYMQMGQHFEIIGQQEKAQNYYEQGIALGFDPNKGR